MKKIRTSLLIAAVCLFGVVTLFAANIKDEDPQVCGGKKPVTSMSKEASAAVADSIAAKYNYTNKNNKDSKKCDMTFLEFGSTGCKPCQMMEEVMEGVKAKHPRVNVVFINVSKKENRALADYFKIENIPTQVLLDKSGKEYFRHIGYFSLEDLQKNFKK